MNVIADLDARLYFLYQVLRDTQDQEERIEIMGEIKDIQELLRDARKAIHKDKQHARQK